MKGEFCRVKTVDGLELQGLLVTPESGSGEIGVLHNHGLDGNFYENRFIDDVAEAVAEQGIDFLTVNSRGHDYISDFIREKDDGTTDYLQIGGIYETFGECIRDISAWTEFLKSRGSKKVILQGHSHGALKAVHYLAGAEDPHVAGLILLSPSDDFGCQRLNIGDRFDEALEVARRLAAEGKDRALMPEGYFHFPVSARTYLDLFDKDSLVKVFNLSRTDADEFSELERIKVPVLTIVGSVDEAFAGQPREYLSEIETHMKNAESFAGHVIEGAPHNYLGFESEVAQAVQAWLRLHFE